LGDQGLVKAALIVSHRGHCTGAPAEALRCGPRPERASRAGPSPGRRGFAAPAHLSRRGGPAGRSPSRPQWRRREANPWEGSKQKRETTRTYPPSPRNRLDKSLPFDPAPSRPVPAFGAESGHKEGTKSAAKSSAAARPSTPAHGSLGLTMSRPEKLIPTSL